MAGHSKWANIKHKKAAQDKKRGKIFTKLIKEVSVSARLGGDDLSANPRLRAAVQAAKTENVPKDNIDRAIKKATGADAEDYVEVNYEGYGVGGVAIFVETATDNQTRTVGNVRSYFNKNGGSLGKDGCLEFIFSRQASFLLAADKVKNLDEFTLNLIDAGAEEIEVEGEHIFVTGEMENFGPLQSKFEDLGIDTEEAVLERTPTTTKEIDEETFQKNMKLIEILEEDDDVQKVYHNMDVPDEYYEHLENS